jgi:hypothetical protein
VLLKNVLAPIIDSPTRQFRSICKKAVEPIEATSATWRKTFLVQMSDKQEQPELK